MAEEATAVAAPVVATAIVADPAAPAVVADTPAVVDTAVIADPAAVIADPAAKVVDPAALKPVVERVVPETYELKAPEGLQLDAVVATEFSAVAKELGLTQTEAQTVIEKMTPLLSKADAARDSTRIQTMVDKAAGEWAVKAATDKEFGGADFDKNMATARETFKAYGTPELSSLLKASGLETHPEIIRWAFRIGKQLAPDGKVIAGNNASSAVNGTLEERAAAKLYGA